MEKMTPASVELALEIQREIEARPKRLISCAVRDRARADGDRSRTTAIHVGRSENRLVADTLESEWNDKRRAMAHAREEREPRQADQLVLDDTIRQRLVVVKSDN